MVPLHQNEASLRNRGLFISRVQAGLTFSSITDLQLLYSLKKYLKGIPWRIVTNSLPCLSCALLGLRQPEEEGRFYGTLTLNHQ